MAISIFKMNTVADAELKTDIRTYSSREVASSVLIDNFGNNMTTMRTDRSQPLT